MAGCPSAATTLVALLLVVCPAAVLAVSAGAAPYAEHQIKAEFVVRFARFVHWPAPAAAAAAPPFVVCLLGHDKVADSMTERLPGRLVKDRAVEVRRPALEDVGACQLAWIAESEGPRLPGILARTAGQPVLTVSCTAGWAQRGVIINIQRVGSRLGFEINLDAALRSHLQLSPKLLRLGRIVARATGDGGEAGGEAGGEDGGEDGG